MKRIALILIVVGLLLIACEKQPFPGQAVRLDNARFDQHNLVEVPLPRFSNMNVDTVAARRFNQPMDADSIELYMTADSQRVYHPVMMCYRALQLIATFVKTGDSLALHRAEKYAAKLRDLSHEYDGALFAPYEFDHRVHQQQEMLLKAPFYSGMAQGEMLSVMIRLHHLTGKEEYFAWAHQTFLSLVRVQPLDTPWVSRVDLDGYFWIEEYTFPEGMDQTLNGFIAAVYGVYDYYVLTRDPRARLMWDACLTTLRRYLPDYRRPGMSSYYCLGHGHAANAEYHRLHISMCRELARLSGDEFFVAIARQFNEDSRATEPF